MRYNTIQYRICRAPLYETSRGAIHESSYTPISVRKFWRTQILTCVTLFTKLFLRTKNRKFVRKYTHSVSCGTTENFCKDSELMKSLWVKLPRCLLFIALNTLLNEHAY